MSAISPTYAQLEDFLPLELIYPLHDNPITLLPKGSHPCVEKKDPLVVIAKHLPQVPRARQLRWTKIIVERLTPCGDSATQLGQSGSACAKERDKAETLCQNLIASANNPSSVTSAMAHQQITHTKRKEIDSPSRQYAKRPAPILFPLN